MVLKHFKGVFSPGAGGECEIVSEEIIVPVNVSHGQDLQEQAVVSHQIGKTGVGVNHHFVGQS